MSNQDQAQVSAPKLIRVPAIGEPELERELSDGELAQIVVGLLVPNQAAGKQMARRLREFRERDGAQPPAIPQRWREWYDNTSPFGIDKSVLKCAIEQLAKAEAEAELLRIANNALAAGNGGPCAK